MKRTFVASAAAAVLALAVLPGSALAALPGTVDQDSSPASGTYSTDAQLVQTFTAGRTGALTHIELYCSGNSGSPTTIQVAIEAYMTHSADCPATIGWTDFVLIASYGVIAGLTYTIHIDVGTTPFTIGVAASNYSGGEATLAVPPGTTIPGVSDFAFRTYVEPLQTTANIWSPTTAPRGVSTSVSLTTTVAFPDISLNPLLTPMVYRVQLVHLPSWFTPTGAPTCTGPMNPADCNLTTLEGSPGIQWQGNGGAATLRFVILGRASPGADDDPESVEVFSCVLGNSDGVVPPTGTPYFSLGMCMQVSSGLGIGRVPTPPPTTAIGRSGSSGGLPLWWLPAGLCALLSSLLVVRRQIQRLR